MCALVFLSCLQGAAAQPRSAGADRVILHGGTIITSGPVGTIEEGALTIAGEKIESIINLSDLEESRSALGGGVFDCFGMYVTPGLIDAWTDLGLNSGGQAMSGAATNRAIDALDGYDRHAFEQALRQGVTALCLEPPAVRGVVGTAALVRLVDLDDLSAAATTPVALVIRLGLTGTGPLDRLREFHAVRKTFEDAKAYRETWEQYQEELEQYVKDLKAGKTVRLEKEQTTRPAPQPGGPSGDPGRRGPRRGPIPRPRPPRDSAVNDPVADTLDELSCGLSARGERDGSGKTPRPCSVFAGATAGEGAGRYFRRGLLSDHEHEAAGGNDSHSDDELSHPAPDVVWQRLMAGATADEPPAPPRRGERGGGEGAEPGVRSRSEGEIKKPQRPAFEAEKEVLVEALKRKLPVRVEAHRPIDILNALELAGQFNLDVTLSGGSGARLVADDRLLTGATLGDEPTPVILGGMIRTGQFENNAYRDHSPTNAARVAAAGVPVVIGSGMEGGANTHYLRLNAALAVGFGLDRDAALRAITIEAAKVCGAGDRLGSLEPGKLADVVVWNGHPLAADSVVEHVFVGGREVYRRARR